MGWETFQFGRLCLDGEPQRIPAVQIGKGCAPDYKEGQGIDIMGTAKEHSITWVKPDGINLFVADRVVLKNVSWEDLKATGFVDGKTVDIGGKRYRCRLLQVGSSKNTPNEWDRVLDATSEDNDLWHWEDMFFWGADTATTGASYRAVRGWVSARHWFSNFATNRRVIVGFRPALEPLPINTLFADTVIELDGQKFAISQLYGVEHKMFYPQLTPIDVNPFWDIPDGSIVKMYSALAVGKPARTDLNEPEPMPQDIQITITDRYYGDEFLIPWVISNGVAVAAKPVFKKKEV